MNHDFPLNGVCCTDKPDFIGIAPAILKKDPYLFSRRDRSTGNVAVIEPPGQGIWIIWGEFTAIGSFAELDKDGCVGTIQPYDVGGSSHKNFLPGLYPHIGHGVAWTGSRHNNVLVLGDCRAETCGRKGGEAETVQDQ